MSGFSDFYTGGSGFNLQDYDQAINRAKLPDFNFDLPQNDPELINLRARALGLGQNEYNDKLNEVARSGLMGTSAGFNTLEATNRGNAHDLLDLTGNLYARRRAEALGLYQGEQDWRRHLELSRLGGLQNLKLAKLGYQQQDKQSMGEALGGIGAAAAEGLVLKGGV